MQLADLAVSWERRVVLIVSYSSRADIQTGAGQLDNLSA